MSSSSEVRQLATPELRSGTWTRLGSGTVLGDPVTEETLSALAESTRTVARSQGYAVGWAEGQRAARAAAEAEAAEVAAERTRAEQHRAREHATALAALTEAVDALRTETARVVAAVEAGAADLAWELTRTIVGHAVADVDAVRRALALDPGSEPVLIRVHPDAADVDAETAVALADRGATLVADPALAPGDALVEGPGHVLDLRVRTALERVRKALS